MNKLGNIYIEGTTKTPQIDFNRFTGELILAGKSIPENAAKVYEPLLAWVSEYISCPKSTTNLRLNLEYFNTASSIWLAKIVRELSKITVVDYILVIHLYFDIEDYDEMDLQDIKAIVGSLIDNIGDVKVSMSLRTYGIDESGTILKESTILV